MAKLPNTLSTLWLVAALVLAPWSTLSATNFVDAESCPMHEQAGVDHGDANSNDENSCPQCSNHECGSGGCSHKGCTATLHLALPESNLSFQLNGTDSLLMTVQHSHHSLNTPPLLRPPA